MIKQVIVLDEDKINREGKYDINKMWEAIDALFAEKELIKVEKGVYQSNPSSMKDDEVNMGAIIVTLSEVDWFMNNVTVWQSLEENCVNDIKQDMIDWDKQYGSKH